MPISRDTGRRQGTPPYTPPPTTTTGTIPTLPPEQQGPTDMNQVIADILSGAGGDATSPTPIGVGPGFQVQQPYGNQTRGQRAPGSHGFDLGGGPGSRVVGPRYFADDEYAPANYKPNIIASMQRDMASVGLYDQNASLISGDWGEESASAFRRLLAYANQHGMPWQIALNHLRAQIQGTQGGALAGGTGGRFRIDRNGNLVPFDQPADREPLVTHTTDPRTLNILFRELSMNLLGQALSPDQVTSMTAAYNQMEAQRQQEAYNAQVAGGSVLDIPSPESFGQAQLEAEHPQEVATNKGLNYMSDAMQMLASPAWGI